MSVLFNFLRPHLQCANNKSLQQIRNISRNAVKFEKSVAGSEQGAAESAAQTANISHHTHRPNTLEKRFLVWSGRYRNVAEIPDLVSHEAVEKARNKARIRIANYMMVATAFACLLVVISGKRAADRGETVQKQNLDWHRKVNEEAIKAKEALK